MLYIYTCSNRVTYGLTELHHLGLAIRQCGAMMLRPTLGAKNVNITYFKLFGSPGRVDAGRVNPRRAM